MDTPWIRFVSQAGIYGTFALVLLWAVRRGRREWAPLVSACGYAILFEHWNMLRYAHSLGGYHYHAGSWLWVWGDVPLYIPLAWAFILATSRSLTDSLGLRPWARPFADALLALLIDVSMDAVAIRLKFWYWHGLSWNDGFFGVPADNFVGWLLVSFTFSALTRALWSGGETQTAEDTTRTVGAAAGTARRIGKPEDADPTCGITESVALTPAAPENADGTTGAVANGPHSGTPAGAAAAAPHEESTVGCQAVRLQPVGVKIFVQIALIPPVAYLLYLGLESIVHVQYALFHAETLHRQLYVLAGTIAVFGFVVAAGTWRRSCANDERAPHAAAVHGPRQVFHLFGLIGLLCVPAALRAPALWALAGSVWAIEWTIALYAANGRGRASRRI